MLKPIQLASLLSGVALLGSVTTQAGEDWQYSGRINAWFPETSGETALPGEQDFTIEVDDVIDSLEFAFMGSLEARKGRWGVYSDFMYSSIGDSNDNYRQGNFGLRDLPAEIKASVDVDVDTYFVTAAGYYRAIDSGRMSLDILFGTRYIDVKQTIEWEISGDISGQALPGRNGKGEVEVDNWDALLGVRGRIPLGENTPWLIPYYIDVGTGDSDLTWQASTGIGYEMGTWGIALTWRYLSYDLDSGSAVADLDFSGPAAVVEFAW